MAWDSPKRKYTLYTELGKLVGAGFGIREAARVVLDGKPGGGEAKILNEMLAGLDQGETIAASFGRAGLTKMELGVIAAGEKGGRLGEAFEHLADYFALLATARRDATMAMIYPLVLLHVGLVLWIIPADVMVGFSAETLIPRAIKVVLVTYAVVALVVLAIFKVLAMGPHSAAADRWLNRLPMIGAARKNLAMTRFTKVYHAGLAAGLTMSETANMAGEAAHSGAISKASKRIVETAERGEALGPVFVSERTFPKAFARSYLSAEESGTLDKDLVRWAKVFEADAARAVKALSVSLPKLGYALIVVMIVWKIIAFYSGYYSSLEQIGI